MIRMINLALCGPFLRCGAGLRPPTRAWLYRLTLLPAVAVSLLTASVVALAAESTGPSGSAQQEWVVAVANVRPGIISLGPDGKPHSLGIDTVESWALKSGRTIRYRFYDSTDAMVGAVAAGEADLVAGVVMTPERSDRIAFSVPYVTLRVSLGVRSGNSAVNGIEDLAGKPVAAVEGNFTPEMEREYNKIRPVMFKQPSEALFALLSGQVDGMIYYDLGIQKLLHDMGLEDRVRIAGGALRELRVAFGFRKDRPDLAQEANAFFATFSTTDEYRKRFVKYYGKPEPFWTTLRVGAIAGLLLALVVVLGILHHFRVLGLNRRLHVSESRYARALRGTREGLWDWNVRTGEVHFSDRWLEMLGYRPGDLPAREETFFGLVHPDDRARVQDAADAHLQRHAPFDVEMRLRRKHGQYLWVRSRGEAERDAQGRVERMAGSIADISREKAAQAALVASEARFRVLIEEAPDGIFICDPDGNYLDVNPAACGLLGYSRAELLRLNVRDLLAPEDLAADPPDLARIRDGASVVRERLLRRKDGGTVRVEISAKRLPDGSMQAIVRDLTGRIRADRALRESERRLNEAQRIAQVGSWELNLKTQQLTWSAEIFRMFEISPERFGATYEAFLAAIHPEDREAVNTAYLRSLETRAPYRILHRLRMADGRIKHVQEDCESEFAPDGTPLVSRGTVQDVTERVVAEQALRESEMRLKRAENLVRVGHYGVDADGGNPVWSDGLKTMWGFRLDENPAFSELVARIHPGDVEMVMGTFAKAIEERKGAEWQFRIVRPDHTEVTLISVAEVSINATDGRPRFFGVMSDITERVRTEAAVRDSEARLQAVIGSISDGFFTLSTDWIYTFVNENAANFVGKTREQLIGRRIWDVFPEAEGSPFHERYRQVMETQQPLQFSDYYPHLDAWYEGAVYPFERGISIYFHDVTDRKRAEEEVRRLNTELEQRVLERTAELADSEARYRRLVEMLNEGLGELDAQGRFVFVNAAFCRLVGHSREELIGANAESLFDPKHHPRLRQALMARAAGQGGPFEVDMLHKSGRTVHVLASPLAVMHPDGTPLGSIAVFLDVTARVAAEQDLARAREQIAVQQKLATVGQLTATVSHELRNPLGTIRTSTYSLKERLGRRDAGVARTLDRIERNVARCDNIITDLLDFSRTRESRPERTELEAWLRAVVEEQERPDWLQVQMDFDVAGLAVSLDQDHLRRAVINVVENAVQAMQPPPGAGHPAPAGRLTVSCRREGERVVITVADTGPGMPPDVLARVFEPLFSTKTYGVGLGLPTVKQIMEQEGGGIDIQSIPGQGTQVALWISLAGRMSGVA